MTSATTEQSRESPPSAEWASGYDDAVREMREDGWTIDLCRSFLEQLGATESDPETERAYGRGYNAAIRRRVNVYGAM